jgi:hypothetical protein
MPTWAWPGIKFSGRNVVFKNAELSIVSKVRKMHVKISKYPVP